MGSHSRNRPRRVQLGVANYVEGNLGCAKEKQYKSIHYMHFHGSGEKTKWALWNAESGNRIGLPRQADGMLELRVDIRGTVGPLVGTSEPRMRLGRYVVKRISRREFN